MDLQLIAFLRVAPGLCHGSWACKAPACGEPWGFHPWGINNLQGRSSTAQLQTTGYRQPLVPLFLTFFCALSSPTSPVAL